MTDIRLEVEPRQTLREQRLLTYATEDGSETEVLWNTRVGFVPFEIQSAASGELMRLTEVGELNPSYVPGVGARVIVDMSEQRARVLAAQYLAESMDALESRNDLQQLFATREDALQAFYNAVSTSQFDVLTVTSAFIQDIQEYRAGGTPVAVSAGLIDPDPAPSPNTESEHTFDRKGRPISFERYLALSSDRSYKVLERTEINENVHVSTIWLGLDHSFSFEPSKPVIFETMAFRRLPTPHVGIGGHAHDFDEDGCWRYCTEEEAIAGHRHAVELMVEKEAEAGRRRN